MRRKIIRLEVSGFFVTDLERELKKIAERMNVTIVIERRDGHNTYPLKVVLTGIPERITPFIALMRSMQTDYFFTIKSIMNAPVCCRRRKRSR